MPRYEPPEKVSLAEAYRAGLLVLDEEQRLLFRGPHLEGVVAPMPDDRLDSLLEQLIEQVRPILDQMVDLGQTMRDDLPVRCSGSRERQFVVEVVTIEGDCRYWILQVQDAEELERSNRDMRLATRFRTLVRYYQTTAHDLKQPIAVANTYLELLKGLPQEGDAEVQQKRLDCIGTIDEALKAVSNSLESMLANLSDADEAQTIFDLREVMDRTGNFISAQARMQNVRFDFRVPGEPVQLKGNADQFRQVLTNLCVNALEAMAEGGSLSLTADRVDHHMLIRVADTGVGMDEQTAQQAFRMHFSTKSTGNGVGLNGVQQIVESMDGHIAFETAPGEGTAFEVRLPIHQGGSAAT